MAMRIGRVDGKPVKRLKRINNDTILVQPVKAGEAGKLLKDGKSFEVNQKKFIKGRLG